MDNKDDEAARKARAESIRERISGITNKPEAQEGGGKTGSSGDATSEEQHPSGENPREFIHRRMHELDEKNEKND